MLFLDENLPEIIKARHEHLRYVSCRINKKLHNLSCGDASCCVCLHTYRARSPSPELLRLAAIIKHNVVLETMIDGKPDELIIMSNHLWGLLIPGFSWGIGGYDEYKRISKVKKANRTAAEQAHYEKYHSVKKAFNDAFEYETWFNGDEHERYDAYTLAQNLNRNTCTYCNRIYTHTVDKGKHGKVTRPQFDHWFSKSKHPSLAMSFFNLIPSCSVCNSSVKGTLDFEIGKHLHPYVDINCQDTFVYSYHYDRSMRRYNIDIVNQNPADVRIKTTYDDLKLKQVFDTHHAELADLIKIKKAYSTKYIQRIKTAFPQMNLSEAEVYRLAFGVEFDGNEFYKRPLSKFKKDILMELKLVK